MKMRLLKMSDFPVKIKLNMYIFNNKKKKNKKQTTNQLKTAKTSRRNISTTVL